MCEGFGSRNLNSERPKEAKTPCYSSSSASIAPKVSTTPGLGAPLSPSASSKAPVCLSTPSHASRTASSPDTHDCKSPPEGSSPSENLVCDSPSSPTDK